MDDIRDATKEELKQRIIELETQLTTEKANLKALDEERNLLRMMIDNIPDYIYAKDSQSRFIMCNLNTAISSGVAHSEDMIGKTDFDFLPVEQATGFFRDEQAIIQTGNPLFHREECITNQATGQDKWLDTIKTPFRDSSGQIIGIVGIGRDITERRREQATLRETEAELNALYNATSHLFRADNLLTLGEQIVQAVHQEFGQMDCGILLIDPSHHYLNRMVRAGEYPVLTDTLLSLSGQGLVPEAIRTGQVVYVADTHQDSRYLANVKQTRSELVIPLTTANGVIGVFDLQSPHLDGFSERDQRLLSAYAERAAAAIESKQLYAEVQERAAQLEWRVLQRNVELQRSQQKLQAIVNAGKPLQFEESVLQDDGLHTYIASKVPLMDSDGQIYAICGIATDITNLKQMEAHLLESLEKERELHELKSQFVMMASHEFRTPLTIIQSSHELLFRYMERMDKLQRQKHFDEVRKQII